MRKDNSAREIKSGQKSVKKWINSVFYTLKNNKKIKDSENSEFHRKNQVKKAKKIIREVCEFQRKIAE